MKILMLLRHAKSSWKDTSLSDFERPLNERGRKAAETIGRYIRKNGLEPELVLSSPAVRARETIGIVVKAARLQAELRYDERIYEADSLRLTEVVSQVDEDFTSVMIVGHNPGMEELLELWTGYSEHMVTAALAKIQFSEADKWSKVSAAKGSLELMIAPKEIAG
jgi:phosphohistidine phosphatase